MKQVHVLNESDVSFLESINSPYHAPTMRHQMESTKPSHCRKHREVQKYLQNTHGRAIDKPSWEINSKIVYDDSLGKK